MASTNGPGAGTTTAPAPSNDLSSAATDLYVNSFQDIEPRRVHGLLTSRLRVAEQFNQDLAEYFKQRSLIEDAYVKSLLRLARHPITTVGSGPTTSPGEELGEGLSKIQAVLEKELTEIATTHTVFQRRMLQEVEVPLKEKATKFEWGRTRTYDTNLLSTIKELEDAEAKASKSSAKLAASPGGKKHELLQQKADEDRRILSRVRDQYLTESPFTLQHYQTVDSDRLGFLAETIARFETIQNDHARERMEIAEKGMVQTLAFDPREEMQSFAVRYGTVGGATGARAPSRAQANGRTTAEQRDREAMPPPAVPASAAPGIARQASVRSSSRQSASDAPSIRSSNPPTSSGGGLKSRFTGILNRSHRNSHMPSFHHSSSGGSESPAPTPSITTTAADEAATPTRGSSRLGGDLTPRQSRLGDDDSNAGDLLGPSLTPERATTPTDSGAKVNRRSSFLPGMMQRRKTSKSAPSRPPNDIRRGSSSAANKAEPLPSPPMSGGTTGSSSGYEMAQQDALAAISEDRARDRPLPQMSQMQAAGVGAGLGMAAGAGAAAAAHHAGGNKVDAEGFSLPPPDHDRKPWEGAGAGGQPASLMDDDDQPGGLSGGPSSGVAQFAIAPAPAPSSQQNPAEQDAALQRMKSTLLSSASGPQRRTTGGPRGRRDVRNSTFIGAGAPIPDDMPLAEAARLRDVPQRTASPGIGAGAFTASPPGSMKGLPSPSSPSGVGAGAVSPFDVSRSGSISSEDSKLARQAANPFGSPSLAATTTGLRASITETVNVLIKGGVVQRAMVTGEVGLLLKGLPAGPIRFRVTNFERFEKVAPNPSLLQSIPDAPGEYQLNPSLFDRQGERQVVLKYQVHVAGGEDSRAYVPIEVTPQWRCEPMQTSFLLNYNLNPACNLLTEESPFGEGSSAATIEQVSFVGQLSASVGSVQSRPEGEWNQAEGKMTWKGDDFPLSSSTASAPRKILTRFVHDKEGLNTVSPLAVKWIVKGKNVSGVGLEIVAGVGGGEGAVTRFEEVAMTTVSGKFLAA